MNKAREQPRMIEDSHRVCDAKTVDGLFEKMARDMGQVVLFGRGLRARKGGVLRICVMELRERGGSDHGR